MILPPYISPHWENLVAMATFLGLPTKEEEEEDRMGISSISVEGRATTTTSSRGCKLSQWTKMSHDQLKQQDHGFSLRVVGEKQ